MNSKNILIFLLSSTLISFDLIIYPAIPQSRYDLISKNNSGLVNIKNLSNKADEAKSLGLIDQEIKYREDLLREANSTLGEYSLFVVDIMLDLSNLYLKI